MYLLFGGDAGYPNGGWMDFKGDFDTVQQAIRATEEWDHPDPWYEVVDLDTLTVVAEKY